MNIIILYLTIVTFIAFIIMGYDKNQAKQRKRRISERTLFFLAFIGGSFGMYLGMKRFRHKTRHRSFAIGIPVLIIVQISGVAFMIIQART